MRDAQYVIDWIVVAEQRIVGWIVRVVDRTLPVAPAGSAVRDGKFDVTGDINPGNSIQAKAALDVPPGTMPAHVELHDSAFSGGVSVAITAPTSGGGGEQPVAPTSTSTGW